jgi:extradiol dioxygenase family protein
MTKISPFHVAVPVNDLETALAFYLRSFGCNIGRSTDSWVDLDLYGHQFVLHKVERSTPSSTDHNPVDGKSVPVPHYGVVLDWDEWNKLSEHLKSLDTDFIIDPYIRFQGETGEQATLFLLDPSGNALEFKSFKDKTQLFAKD